MKAIHIVALLLLVIGGLNWLLVGIFGWDVGELFGGQSNVISRVIYVLVGLSAIWVMVTHKKACVLCSSKPGQQM